MLVFQPAPTPHFPRGSLVSSFCLRRHHLRIGLCVPGEAHPTGWDYAAVVRQTGTRSIYLRSGSRDCGDRNHGENGEL